MKNNRLFERDEEFLFKIRYRFYHELRAGILCKIKNCPEYAQQRLYNMRNDKILKEFYNIMEL